MKLIYRLRDFLNARFPDPAPPDPVPPEPEPDVEVWCAKCSETTTLKSIRGRKRIGTPTWFVENPPLVVQGKALGICPSCLGKIQQEEEEQTSHDFKRCEGKAPQTGTYYKAKAVNSWDSHSCTDYDCVQYWLDNVAEAECHNCEQEISYSIYTYVDGKLTETTRCY